MNLPFKKLNKLNFNSLEKLYKEQSTKSRLAFALSALGVVLFLTIALILPFTRSKLFSELFIKPFSRAATVILGNGDANNDGAVNSADIQLIAQNYTNSLTNSVDQYGDGVINWLDFANTANIIQNITPIPTSPTPTTAPTTSEWTQFGHDAQRTSYTPQTVATPWKFAWSWNDGTANAQTQTGRIVVPPFLQPITGNGKVYMIGNNTVYALDQTTGAQSWIKTGIGTLSTTPAYSNGYLYVVSQNGNIYKLDSNNGGTSGSFNTSDSISLAPLVVGNNIYVVTLGGKLFSVNMSNMAANWTSPYLSNAKGGTMPAYSAKWNMLIFGAEEATYTNAAAPYPDSSKNHMTVHAVDASTGTRKWVFDYTNYTGRYYEDGLQRTTDPCASGFGGTANTACLTINGSQFDNSWPVIAEQHDLVLIRTLMDHNSLYRGPGFGGAYPSTNAQIVSFLGGEPYAVGANRRDQNLLPLKLSDGTVAFTPAVNIISAFDGGTARMGPVPIVKVVGGQEVAYVYWRNVQNCSDQSWCDGRWDARPGEMVLDNSHAISGCDSANGVCNAGYVRFVQYTFIPGDEVEYTTMSGDIFFENRWEASFARSITDRSSARGGTYSSGITTTYQPAMIWAVSSACTPVPGTTSIHYCSNPSIFSWGTDGRYYDTPTGSFYEYYNDWCSLHNTCLKSDVDVGPNSFTVVSNNLVIIEGVDGGLIVLKNGNPLASTGQVNLAQNQAVLGTTAPTTPISAKEAYKYLDQKIIVEDTLTSVTRIPAKGYYLSFGDFTRGGLLVQIFNKDLSKFNYDLLSLKGKHVQVEGRVSLYPFDSKSPVIIVTNSDQIRVLN